LIARASRYRPSAISGTDLERLAALLSRAQRDLTLRIAAALEAEGCAVDRWRALSLLADDEGHPMVELAEHTLLSPPTLTRLVDGMVSDNLVHRRPDERDRRRVLVFATRRGRALHRRIAARIERERDSILSPDLSREDLERLAALLGALTTPG
jgi:DNA-binding MarR family transcriptional regulator